MVITYFTGSDKTRIAQIFDGRESPGVVINLNNGTILAYQPGVTRQKVVNDPPPTIYLSHRRKYCVIFHVGINNTLRCATENTISAQRAFLCHTQFVYYAYSTIVISRIILRCVILLWRNIYIYIIYVSLYYKGIEIISYDLNNN